MSKKALYPGSFDMFTNGHLSVLKQACDVFDEVIVCISHNPTKKRRYNIDSCIEGIKVAIQKFISEPNRVKVVVSESTIPAQIAEEYHCGYIVRGIRNTSDYLYEDQLAAFNAAFDSSIKTIYFRAENSDVSSTMVSSFLGVNKLKAQEYVPYNLDILMKV